MTQTFDPARHPDGTTGLASNGDVPMAEISEGSDAAAGISSVYSMLLGDSFSGQVGTGGDVDWVQVTFEAGTTYEINALGSQSGGGSLYDTDLRLYTSNGTLIEYDDYDGEGWDASITYSAETTGTYWIAVSAFSGTTTGSYTLELQEGIAPHVPGTDGTVAQLAEYLKSGNTNTEFTYNTSISNVITVNLNGLTNAGKQLARWAMEAWEMVADLDFQEVNSGEMITVDDEDSGAFAYYPNAGSTSSGVEVNVSKSWVSSYGSTIGSYSFQTYIHEFGHALGLNHLGSYNGSANYNTDAIFSNDSWQMSVMSYFSQSENTSINASYATVTTAQVADIFAVQDFYGAADGNSVTAGNTVYGLGSNLGNYMDDLFAVMVSGTSTATVNNNTQALTLFDQGGTDLLDLSYLAANKAAAINLNGGTFSDIGNKLGIIGIALGTVIENLYTGAGSDTVTGNSSNNVIEGGSGNDTIFGWGGNDTLSATSGQNEIFGDNGNDTVTGGSGNDVVGGGSGNDIVSGMGGDDTLWGGSGNDVMTGNNGADVGYGGSGADNLDGGSGADTMWGGDGQDIVSGGADDDEVGGGGGHDTLHGGDGNDVLWGTWGNDTLYGDAGNDLLGGGDKNDVLYGGTGNDTLLGSWGSDSLFGGGGADRLELGVGTDVATGGAGADTFVLISSSGDNTITDFDMSEGDRLQLDADLWAGTLTTSQVVSTYASVSEGEGVLFSFGDGTTILLEGLTTTSGLQDVIDFA